jgi:D-ala D-ala ligase N-terminal domain protein
MIGLLCGGSSSEHEISIVSAMAIYHKLDEVKFLYLDKSNNLYYIKKPSMDKIINKKGKKINLNKKSLLAEKIDFIILVNHGYGVEDTIGALLDFYEIPYLGSGVYPGTIAMDKWLCYEMLNSDGILQIKKQIYKPYDKLELKFPVIIKPRRCGSSLGINVCNDEGELIKNAIEALKYDSSLIVEEYLDDMQEMSAAFYDDGTVKMSKVELINYNDKIFNFKEKYLSSHKMFSHQFINDAEMIKRIYEIGSLAYKTIGAKDIVRIDFFYKDSKIYLNEINTIPGSLSYYMFDDFEKIIKELVEKNKKDHFFRLRKKNSINLDVLKFNNKLK